MAARGGALSRLIKCPMPGQLSAWVPPGLNQESHPWVQLKGITAISIHFYETHVVIDNSAMITPLEAFLLRTSSGRLLRTTDFQLTGERKFPLARLRE